MEQCGQRMRGGKVKLYRLGAQSRSGSQWFAIFRGGCQLVEPLVYGCSIGGPHASGIAAAVFRRRTT